LKEEKKSNSCLWQIIGLILIIICLPIIWFGAFIFLERANLRKDVEEFNKQKFKKEVFNESRKILMLSEFIEENKKELINNNCLILPKDTVKLDSQLTISIVVDSLKKLLNNIKTKEIISYEFCNPKFSKQSKNILSTEINLKTEKILKESTPEIKHYIYNNKIVRTSSNPENVYEYNDLERDTFFRGTFRYSIRVRPNSL